MLDMGIDKAWKAFAGGDRIPYLGVAAHTDWIAQHQALIPRLYATYKAAAAYIAAHPDEVAKLIAPKATPGDQKGVASLIRANDRLGMGVVAAKDIRKEIEAVYKAGVDVGYLKSLPSAATIYDKPIP
jgi:ABC-type nitrate/sulfonate/bicarbonate transport system substrate-binding protein